MERRWRDYSSYLRERYGVNVYRVGVDGGFSCPNREDSRRGGCAFCDGTGSIAQYQRVSESSFNRSSAYSPLTAESILERFRFDSIEQQIKKGEAFLRERYHASAFSLYFQSWTNTYDSPENLRRIYDRALSFGEFRELIISTRPDCLPPPVLELLESYITPEREVWVELGLQSANDETLKRINRGHGLEEYMRAAEALHERGIRISTHVILGLPGEGRADYRATALALNRAKSEAVKIHNLHISGGTRLEEEFREGELTSSSLLRHVENTELFLRHINSDMIVQRLICETPMHRLVSPRHFPDKFIFMKALEEQMERNGSRQGDLYEL